MIARPARVRIRSRKPCVLDRRRLFGWKVHLLTRYSYCTTSAGACPPADGHARGRPPKAGSLRERTAGRTYLRRTAAPSQTPTSIAEDRVPPARRPQGRLPRLHPGRRGRTEARRGDGHPNSVRRARERLTSVAPLWTGLLASPSLRVVPHGTDEGPTGRSHRRSRTQSACPIGALTSTDIVHQDRCHGPRWTTAAGRAHPVDSDVEAMCAGTHSGSRCASWSRGRAGGNRP